MVSGPKSYRDFRETDPRALYKIKSTLGSLGNDPAQKIAFNHPGEMETMVM